MVVLTPAAFISGESYPVDALLLAPIQTQWLSLAAPRIFQWGMLMLLGGLGWALNRRGWNAKLQRICLCLLTAWLMLANVAGYSLLKFNRSAEWSLDAREVAATIAGESALMVAEDDGYFWHASTALDFHLRKSVPAAELDDLIENTLDDGRYASFLPPAYWTEAPRAETGEARLLVMPNSMLNQVALAEGAVAYPSTNGCYALVTLPADGPWVHSAVSGLNGGWIQAGSRLTVFDPGLASAETVLVQLKIYAQAGSSVTMHSAGNVQTFYPAEGDSWISASFPDAEPLTVSLSATGGIYVETYLVQ